MNVIVAGAVLEVRDRETGQDQNRRWVKEYAIQTGKADISRIRLDPSRYQGVPPVEGDVVALNCWVSTWTGRNGAGMTVSAQSPADLSEFVPAGKAA